MKRKNVNANKSTIACFVPCTLFGVMGVMLSVRNIMLGAG